MHPNTLEVKRTFNTSPDKVFAAWTQPEILEKWWCTPGYRLEKVEIDLRPSGNYRYELVPEDGHSGPICTMEGQFQEVAAPENLVYSWTIRAADFEVTDTTVQVSFKPNAGSTDVTLVHTGFKSQEAYDLHELDWPIVMSNLAELLSTPSAKK